MAERRCFHRKILESDQFYGLPASAQMLYVHLNMAADDDGFLNCAASVAARSRTGKSDLRLLVQSRFLLQFGEIYVVKHWRIANSLKNDRTRPPAYPGIAAKLWVRQDRAYTEHTVPGGRTLLEVRTGVSGIQNGIQMESKMDSQEKRREEKGTEEKGKEENRTEAAFRRVWGAYPTLRRGDVQKAWEAFGKVWETVCDPELILEQLEGWKKSQQWSRDGGRYIPNLCNWLDRGLWQALPEAETSFWGASGKLGDAELEAIRRTLQE